MGSLYYERKQYNEAIFWMNRTLQSDPSNVNLALDLAIVCSTLASI